MPPVSCFKMGAMPNRSLPSRTARFLLLPSLLSVLLAAPPPAFGAQDSRVSLQRIYQNVDTPRPVAVVVAPDGTGRHFLVQQRGQIKILPKDEAAAEALPFLDLSARKLEADDTGAFEEGLVGFAFHPKFAENRKFYLCYTCQAPKRLVLIEMQTSAASPDKADPATERLLLEVPLPFWNHHGGNLLFGADGMLYLGIGDGGGPNGGDPLRLAQNLFSLNGKMLRLDVNKRSDSRPYGIPADNPFAGKSGVREEIYALGIRNPWGIFLESDGTFWFADVGQSLKEELNLLQKGGNYGWSFREGMDAFPGRSDAPPESAKFIDPILTYGRDSGISITGGVVYSGRKIPDLKGAYIYGDWGSGRIWALHFDKAAKKVVSNTLLPLASTPRVQPTAFCEDASGEILILDWNGKIFRLTGESTSP